MVIDPDRATVTNSYQGGPPNQNPNDQACDFPYQTLPEYLLAVRNPLAFLDWSTNAYHSPDLGLDLPLGGFTNRRHRGLGRGIDLSVVGGVAGWASVARVIHS